jgi:hypothetical protein
MALRVTFIAIVAVTVALYWFSFYIADYEATQPKHVVRYVMDKYFSAPDYEQWAMEAIGSYLSEFESPEDYRQHIRRLYEGGAITSRSPQAAFTGNQREYTVYSDGIPFAKFVVAKTAEKSRFGFALWRLHSISPVSTSFSSRVEVHALILPGSTLLINSKPVSEGFFVGEGEPIDAAEYLPSRMSDQKYRIYTVEGLSYVPVVSVTNRFGQATILTPDGDLYCEELQYSPMPDDVQALARDALLAYCRFCTNDSNLNAVARYYDRTAPVWDDVLVISSWLWVYPRHTGYDYQDIEISDYYPYNDEAFSVRIRATQIIVRSSTESLSYPLDFTIYFVKQANGSFLVYNQVSHV